MMTDLLSRQRLWCVAAEIIRQCPLEEIRKRTQVVIYSMYSVDTIHIHYVQCRYYSHKMSLVDIIIVRIIVPIRSIALWSYHIL